MKKTTIKLLIAFLIILAYVSCQKRQDLVLDDQYIINQDLAKNIATRVPFNILSMDRDGKEGLTNLSNDSRTITSFLAVPDDFGKTAYFIFNFKNGGFLILSADKRIEPVLAFSEKNSFPLGQKFYPSGLVAWLFNQKENIQLIRERSAKRNMIIERLWDNLLNGQSGINYMAAPLPDEPDCNPYIIQKGPYLQTTWDQECGYNALLPLKNCGLPCGRAYTGCVATAMGQVMKFHSFPYTYDWVNMPNDWGSNATAVLMKDIGKAVGMDYDCDGSGADTEDEVASSLRNDFGYSSASYSDYKYWVVQSELNYGRPVILRGGRKTYWFIFPVYTDGHAWVCDGYSSYVDPCYGSYLKLHMNWGWGGNYDDWYSFNNFNPGTSTFNYKPGMVYNIKP